MVQGGARNASQVNLGGDIEGGKDKGYQEVHAVGYGIRDSKGSQEGGWRF